MAIDWNAIKDEMTQEDLDALEGMGKESSNDDYPEIPDGEYEVRITKLELGLSKNSGNLTGYMGFRILTGEYKGNMIFYNPSLGGKSAGWKIKMFSQLLTNLKSGVDFSYANFKDKNGEFDGQLFENAVDECYENIVNDKIEYAIRKSTNKGGYTSIEITQVFNE